MLALFACLALLVSTGAAAHGPPLDLTRPNSADARHSAGRALATPPAAADARATAGAEAFSLRDADAVTEDEDDYAMLELESLEQENRYADGRACVWGGWDGRGGRRCIASSPPSSPLLLPHSPPPSHPVSRTHSRPLFFLNTSSGGVILRTHATYYITCPGRTPNMHAPAFHARYCPSRPPSSFAPPCVFFLFDSECWSLWGLTRESLA